MHFEHNFIFYYTPWNAIENHIKGEKLTKNLNIYEELIASYVKIRNPFLVKEKISVIIIQKTTAKAMPLTRPKIPPSVLLMVPIMLKLNSLLIYLARNLTTKIKTTTKITETKTESNFVITGFANEFDIESANAVTPVEVSF